MPGNRRLIQSSNVISCGADEGVGRADLNKAMTLTMTCTVCGVAFKRERWQHHRGQQTVQCSRSCMLLWRSMFSNLGAALGKGRKRGPRQQPAT